MTTHSDPIRQHLASGPATARQLAEEVGVSQPTLSRALSALGTEVLQFGAGSSIQYAIRDTIRGLDEIPIYRVSAEGLIRRLGVLVPVRPDGFVMRQDDGVVLHSDGLPWWLLDMRPQGFLGRAYASRHAEALGLPARINEWSDTHVLRAMMAHGHDAVGNLLLGDIARERFLTAPEPVPILHAEKGEAYARLAQEAASGEIPGSSAGGEQPKFPAFAETAGGPRHMLVKFTLPDANPVTQRWRDLLLAEHHALQTLAAAGVPTARSSVIDHGGQRFLEVERFDRVGALGRRALFSLACVEAEFVGNASATWPAITAQLAQAGHVTPQSAAGAALLYAFGTLIGNTDMHHGNLSFVSDQGRPYTLAPAYDMLPMGFSPRAGGGLSCELPPARLSANVPNEVWKQALELATQYLGRVGEEGRFSDGFAVCIQALRAHLQAAGAQVARLG